MTLLFLTKAQQSGFINKDDLVVISEEEEEHDGSNGRNDDGVVCEDGGRGDECVVVEKNVKNARRVSDFLQMHAHSVVGKYSHRNLESFL